LNRIHPYFYGLLSLGAVVEFRILGPVEVRAAGRLVDIGHARQRAVLAVLLLDLGRAVPAEQLIDRVWGGDPPSSVRNVLYGYVARLKRALAEASEPGVVLARRGGGYWLAAEPDQVDACQFRRRVAEAGAAGDDQHAAALLRGASGLWHGTALAGLSSPWLAGMRERLDLERRAASLDLHDIELRLGRHGALIGELSEAAVAHPADERVIGQLMLALYRSGRQADALRWFDRTRRHLADEYGADPGAELKALHQQILRAEPSLAVVGPAVRETWPPPPASRAGAVADGPVPSGPGAEGLTPRELPTDVSAFTGRAAELDELDQLLAVAPERDARVLGSGGHGTNGTPVVISAISGTAGVGKTALALRWAHHAARHFPDGQLYVNLRGYDPGSPMPATDALAGFLRGLGVAGQDIPACEGERAAMYRSLLAGRRILVVLDNAGSAEQVRPLLPGAETCRVLVTSRDALSGLVARDGARRLDLDLLPEADAIALLRAVIGPTVAADPAAAAALAAQCARLPLALRVAAELAASRPGLPLADLVAELADQRRRLDLLDVGGDPRTSVRAVFSWSCQHLDEPAAGLFRVLGLHPGPDTDAYAAAALTGDTEVDRPRRLLDQLARAHLIQPRGSSRYGLHDLLRAYARELAAQDGEEAGRSALTRLFDYYLHTVATATSILFPAESNARLSIPASAAPAPPMDDPAAARAWLDMQRPSLAAAVAHAAAHGWPSHATRLAAALYSYLDTGGYYPEAIVVHGHARRAARQSGDLAAEAVSLVSLGAVAMRQGHFEHAADRMQQAVALSRQAGDLVGHARALGNLGMVDIQLGHGQRAKDHLYRALALFRQGRHRTGEVRTLTALGDLESTQGRYQQADADYRQALTLARTAHDGTSEAYVLGKLGALELRQDRCGPASDYLRDALTLYCENGDRTGEAYTLTDLGHAELKQGRYQHATDLLLHSLAFYQETGDPTGEAKVFSGLGEILLASGQPEHARVRYTDTLALATKTGDRDGQARAHEGLARAYLATAESASARHHWQEALALYTSLGADEAAQFRARIGCPEPA
jgi:DNA-binding SARP family transcriptional activator/tetratricopeptide (TPR) repeat protein